MRTIAGVPLIYINRSVMIMEPMAAATEDIREREEKEKFRAGLKSKRIVDGGKRKRVDGDENDTPKKKRQRGPKEPNPLSVKKSKKRETIIVPVNSSLKGNADEIQSEPTAKRKRKRKHKSTATVTKDVNADDGDLQVN
jgi:U3 small nucleolar RNA-associated protein 23